MTFSEASESAAAARQLSGGADTAGSPASRAAMIADIVTGLEPQLLEFREDLHRHPELSWEEYRTTARIMDTLRAAGLQPQPLELGTGAWVDIGAGDYIAGFRGDIDALPVEDTCGLDYQSVNPGVAHACGHDIHTTVMIGLALSLEREHQRRRAQGQPEGLGAKLRIIFQPAEEKLPGGAAQVVAAGVLDPLPRVFALHCDPRLPVGTIGTRIGAITSASDLITVTVTGKGGHTSRPHLTQDVVGALAHIAELTPVALSRRIDPRSVASLVWGSIQAGHAPNAIPATGTLSGTLRVLDAEAWIDAGGTLDEIVAHAAVPFGVDVELDHARGVPPVINTEEETTIVDQAAKYALGEHGLTLAEQSMGGEDFGWMSQHRPGSMFRLGTKTPGGTEFDLHRGDYAPDEGAIAHGVKVMAQIALDLAAAHRT